MLLPPWFFSGTPVRWQRLTLRVQFFLDRYSGAIKGKKEPASWALGLELVGAMAYLRGACA
jgi:hypothetical protein